MNLDSKKGNRLRSWLVIVALSALAVFLAVYSPEPENLRSVAVRSEQTINRMETAFRQTVEDEKTMRSLIAKGFSAEVAPILEKKEYSFFLYREDSLVYWNNNLSSPGGSVSGLTSGSFMMKLGNGFYLIMKAELPFHSLSGKWEAVGMFPVKFDYPLQNTFLTNDFNPILDIPAGFEISLGELPGGFPVKNIEREPLFFLYGNELSFGRNYRTWIIFIELLAFVLFFIALALLSDFLASRLNPLFVFIILASGTSLIRYLSLETYPILRELKELPLFNPTLYASSQLNPSLGDLFINSILFFWLALFLFQKVAPTPLETKKPTFRFLFWLVCGFFLFWVPHLIQQLFEGLILNSKISFDISNIISLNLYSFVGLSAVAFILLGYCLLCLKFIRLLLNQPGDFIIAAGAFVLSGILFAIFSLLIGSTALLPFLLLWTVVFIGLITLLLWKKMPENGLGMMLVFLAGFSLLCSNLITHFNQQKELNTRKLFARKLANDRDPITEYLFSSIQSRILEDQFIQKYFRNPVLPEKEFTDRLRYLYFGGYFNKYELNLFPLNADGFPLKEADPERLQEVENHLSGDVENTGNEFLFYVAKPNGSYAYLGSLPIILHQKFLGTLLVELKPKTIHKANVYPELMLEDKVKPPEDYERYDLAVYVKNQLVRQNGNFPLTFHNFMALHPDEEFHLFETKKESWLIYRPDTFKRVVVTLKKESRLSYFAVFSYLFLILLSFLGGLAVARGVYLVLSGKKSLKELVSVSLSTRVQVSMVALIIISFVVTGIITVRYFAGQYESYHSDRLIRKEQAISSGLDYYLKNQPGFRDKDADHRRVLQRFLGEKISELSDINSMDINVYDTRGKLLLSSQQSIFERGLVSDLIHPEAFRKMKGEGLIQFIQTEQIGRLNYLAIYVPILHPGGKTIGYLNLPYFAKEKNLQKETSNFLVSLVNVYVLLLLGGGLLAFILSKSITQPLTQISEKLKLLGLGKSNEPIVWKGDDEIGRLVREYNKMIRELDRSVSLLARSERESAWREMAQQVAHEIKNPLTPMKLSVQHLQRAIQENHPNAPEIARRVSQTLIEQIDNLSHIAGEFSSFAKMPRAQKEKLDLAEILESTVTLFENEPAAIQFTKPENPAPVYADKSQLLRVFSNLIKNAIQAIPDGRDGKIHIRLYQNGDTFVTEVEDNGTGIDPEKQEMVFVPNFTTKSSGTGLGLAMTKQIVDNSNGAIWFETTPGEGTTFFVEIPAYSEET